MFHYTNRGRFMLARTIMLLCSILAILLGAPAQPMAAQGGTERGLNLGDAVNSDCSPNADFLANIDLGRLAAADPTWVRLDLIGMNNATCVTTYRNDIFPRLEGYEIIGLLSNSFVGSADVTLFTTTASQVATAFGDKIDTWQVWNEPNAAATYLAPCTFVDLFAQTKAAIEAVDGTGAIVLNGGFTFGFEGYVDQFYTDGCAANFNPDGFAIHPYAQYPSTAQIPPQGSGGVLNDFIFAAKQPDPGGTRRDRSKPIYVTEFGWKIVAEGDTNHDGLPNAVPNEAVQCEYLQAAYPEFALRGVGVAVWFTIRDFGTDKYGLYEQNGNTRPVRDAFAGTGSCPPCPTSVGGSSTTQNAAAVADASICTPSPQLSYVDSGPYNVGTNCANPSASPSQHDWHFRVEGVPSGYQPIRMDDNIDGHWVAPPCDAANHWPLVATSTADGFGKYRWDIYVAPWPATSFNPPPGKTYTVVLHKDGASDITVTWTAPYPPTVGQIAYRTSSGIFVIKADGSAPRQLTTNATDNYPVWSPDHSRIAFVSSRDGNEEIYVINADGTGLRRLTNSATYDLAPNWSPDGTKILFFSRRAGNAEIYTMKATDGTGLLRLTTNAAEDTYPIWSPNGLRIAFSSTRPGNEEIYVMNANGTGVLRRSSMAGYDHFPYWAPNNQTLLFTGYHTGNDVFTVNASTGSPTKITTVTADDYYASWSPDGTRILFMSVRDGNAEIYVMNANGSAQTRLTNTTVGESYANWSPDGAMITFVRGGDIYVMNANGTGEFRLPNVGKATDLNWWRPMQIR